MRWPVYVVWGLPWIAATSVSAGLVVSESFAGATAPGWRFSNGKVGPGAVLTASASAGIDRPGSGSLRLTSGIEREANGVFYDKPISLGVGFGLTASFDFSVFSGTNPGADGLTFSLFDASVLNPIVGGFGGSLGYASRSGYDGLTGGYLGVGFDELGNYSNPTEGRLGGPGSRPNAIAVRGAGGGQKGYDYITGTTDQGKKFLDDPAAKTRPTDLVHFRHAVVSLFRRSLDSLELTVSLQRGFDAKPLVYIDHFNVIGRFDGIDQPPPPSSLKFGFTGATGALAEIHEIRNVVVTTYGSPYPALQTPEPATWSGALIAIAAGCALSRARRRVV